MDTPRTVAELMKFYTYLADKGLMNSRTAAARAQAAQQVLSVLDDDERRDLAKLDRESTFRRFVNKHGMRFTPESLQTYRHRFSSALDEFLDFAKDPSSFKPPAGARDRARSAPSDSPSPSRATARVSRQQLSQQHVHAHAGLLDYPLPLPGGVVAHLLVPPTLTEADAARVKLLVETMVKALVVKESAV